MHDILTLQTGREGDRGVRYRAMWGAPWASPYDMYARSFYGP
jgi:hypothetical protein